MKAKYRIDWDGEQNIVVVDTDDGQHLELPLGEFARLADRVCNGIFEPTNPAYRKSFKKLHALASAR